MPTANITINTKSMVECKIILVEYVGDHLDIGIDKLYLVINQGFKMLHSMVSHSWGNEHLTKFATYLLWCLTVNHISVQFQALYISVWEIKLNSSQIRLWKLAILRKNGIAFLFFDNWHVVVWRNYFKIPKMKSVRKTKHWTCQAVQLRCREPRKRANMHDVFNCFVF